MENGNAEHTDSVLIYFNRNTFAMTIGGEVLSLECALAIVEQAKRSLETQHRIAAGLAAQAEMKKNMEDQQRVSRILHTVGKH